MTDKVQLYIKAVTQLRQFGNVGLVVLTDDRQSKHVSILCDAEELGGLEGCFKNKLNAEDTLVSVLWGIISANTSQHYEVFVAGIKEGKYQILLQNDTMTERYRLAPVAALTLAFVAILPIYMRAELFERQSMDFNPNTDKMALPLNVLNTELLEHALHRAIDSEDYKMASAIKQEMDNRKK